MTINIANFAVVLILIIMGSMTFTILGVVHLSTKNALKKRGYHPNITQQTYQQLQTDLNKVADDLSDIQYELDEIRPEILQLEFLKYANEDGNGKL